MECADASVAEKRFRNLGREIVAERQKEAEEGKNKCPSCRRCDHLSSWKKFEQTIERRIQRLCVVIMVEKRDLPRESVPIAAWPYSAI